MTEPKKAPPLKTYTIRDGSTFRDAKGRRLTGGQKIDLADDVYELHKDKLIAPPAEAASQTSATPAAKA